MPLSPDEKKAIKDALEESKILDDKAEKEMEEFEERFFKTLPTKKRVSKKTEEDAPSPSKRVLWEQLGLTLQNNGSTPASNLDNAMKVIGGTTDMREGIWWDDFQKRIFTRWNGPLREWADEDDIEMLHFMQAKVGIIAMKKPVVKDAVDGYAKRNKRNEFVEWLDELKWDGVKRCDSFFPTYVGCALTDYTSVVSKNFWVGLVARGLKPGCKLDNMVVLVGRQATKKTQAIEIIGGKWHIEVNCSIRDKDFLQSLNGKLLVDIGELASLGKADNNLIKSILTTKNDYYRATYGHRHQNHFRSCCLIASTNDQEFLDDPTGGRRYWPIEVGEIDLDALRKDRGQLFAEAYALYKTGTTWWEVPESAKIEQEKRRKKDAWEEIIFDGLSTSLSSAPITIWRVANEFLDISKSDLDKGKQMRIANSLKSLGYFKSHTEFGNIWKKK